MHLSEVHFAARGGGEGEEDGESREDVCILTSNLSLYLPYLPYLRIQMVVFNPSEIRYKCVWDVEEQQAVISNLSNRVARLISLLRKALISRGGIS